jgi:hypothetical protein
VQGVADSSSLGTIRLTLLTCVEAKSFASNPRGAQEYRYTCAIRGQLEHEAAAT